MSRQFRKKLLSFLSIAIFAGLFIVYETKYNQELNIDKNGTYSTKEDVSLYLHTYDTLPSNYITKSEAISLGWKASEGNLWDVSDKKSIGGDIFGNREKLLPDANERTYYEADIDYQGGFRGPKRIVYSDDGLIYYTHDHYESFELLYGDES